MSKWTSGSKASIRSTSSTPHRAQPHRWAPEEVSKLKQDGNCIHPYGELALNSGKQEYVFIRVFGAILLCFKKESNLPQTLRAESENLQVRNL